MGCGPSVYVPHREIEDDVINGFKELLSICADPKGFTQKVNDEIRRLWQTSRGYDPLAKKKRDAIDGKIANIRNAIEDGLSDSKWVNSRIQELMEERQELIKASERIGEPPQIDVKTAMEYRKQLGKVLEHGKPAERKKFVRTWVDDIKLAPENLAVSISCKIPEPVVNMLLAGDRLKGKRQSRLLP